MERERLIREVARAVGARYVVHRPEDLLLYEYDGSVSRGLPRIVVLPATTQEASRVVALAYREGIPVVPRGAGTGLSGGAIVAAREGIQVVLTRMRRILEVDPVNQVAVVQPGVVNLDLSLAVACHGLYYAPDPSSQKACTIGGNVAENAGGPHCLRYGVTTNHVLGVEVVLEDGTVTWLGGRSREAPGYDLTGAFVGSEGMLGIATQVMVRLLRAPEAVKTFLAIFDELDSAAQTVSGIIGAGIVPAALEMLDNLAIRAVEAARPMGYPVDAGAVLLVEVDGLREDVEEEGREVERLCREHGVRGVQAAEDAAGRERLWAGRKGALGALGALAPNYYLVDGVVPRTRLPEVLRTVGDISRKYHLPIANVFHAGDGNLHPCILFDERKGETERVLAAGGEILTKCVQVGGVLTGEHGVGLEKKEYMPLLFNEEDMRAMQRLRDAFAPRGLFNPGKVFPGASSCGETFGRVAVARAGGDAWV